jgi:hypothetical protein
VHCPNGLIAELESSMPQSRFEEYIFKGQDPTQ